MTGVLQLILDFSGDLPGQVVRSIVADFLGINQYSHLATSLYGVAFFHAIE